MKSPVEYPVAVVEDDEVIAGGLELHRVPGVLGHFDALPSELAPATAHDVIDPAVVLEGVAAGDVRLSGTRPRSPPYHLGTSMRILVVEDFPGEAE